MLAKDIIYPEYFATLMIRLAVRRSYIAITLVRGWQLMNLMKLTLTQRFLRLITYWQRKLLSRGITGSG
jgi:hypothetical protein